MTSNYLEKFQQQTQEAHYEYDYDGWAALPPLYHQIGCVVISMLEEGGSCSSNPFISIERAADFMNCSAEAVLIVAIRERIPINTQSRQAKEWTIHYKDLAWVSAGYGLGFHPSLRTEEDIRLEETMPIVSIHNHYL